MQGNLVLLLPEILVAGLAFLVLIVDLILRRERPTLLAAIAVLGLSAILVLSLWNLWDVKGSLYNGIFRVDNYALFFKAFFLISGIAIILMSVEYVNTHLKRAGEFYGLILFSILAMMALASSTELLMAYISLELLSFCLYIMAAYSGNSLKSDEAGTKYILLGAFASALLLYGISLLYGIVGVTKFEDINVQLLSITTASPALIASLVFIIAGLGFKIAAVPFHMWAPDVYEGAPTPVTAYIAVVSKAAAFALLLRLFSEALLPVANQWQLFMSLLAAATMTLGNLVAIPQQNIKRLLAYSSIGQVGYLLMGIVALESVRH
jgi:NADH-quinone oxidoreductase subunit N